MLSTEIDKYLDPLCGQGGAGDRRSAPKGLELGVHDLPLVVNLDLFVERSAVNFYPSLEWMVCRAEEVFASVPPRHHQASR